MIIRYSRRDFVIGSALLLSPAFVHAEAYDRIVEIEKTLGGRIGVSALNTANGRCIRHRGDERFAMCSTFKAALVGAVLARCDHGDLALNEQNGRNRIRLGLPADWRVANKPGSSADGAGATNDIAVAWPPGHAPIVISVYTDARETTPERRTMAIAEVARAVGASLVRANR